MNLSLKKNQELGELLGDHLIFRNGKKSPARSANGEYRVFGSNGQIGRADAHNTEGPSIVIGRVGSYCGSLYYSESPLWVTDNAIICESKEIMETRYWYYALQTLNLNNRSSGSGQPLLNHSILRSIRFEASSSEQRIAIAEVLGALDDKIAANNNLVKTVRALCQAQFDELLRGETSIVPLRTVLHLEYGKSLPLAKRVNGNINVFGSGGIVGSHNEALRTGPGVIVGRKGSVGSVYWSDKDYFPIDTTFYVVPRSPDVSLIFCYHLLDSLPLSDMNSDSAVPGLNREEALSLPVRLPEIQPLTGFSKQAEKLFSFINQLSQENLSLISARDVLLPQLISGKIRVREAEAVVDDVL